MPFTNFQRSCLAVAIGQMVAPSGLLAATINVDATCSLAQAVETANNDMIVGDCELGANADTIELPQSEIITLSAVGVNGLPVVTSEITINGNGSTIQRDLTDPNNFRLIEATTASAMLTLNSLTLQGGRTVDTPFPNFHGGAIYAHHSASLIGNNIVIRDNIAKSSSGNGGNGGGIYAPYDTSVSLNSATISENKAYGFGGGFGGIYCSFDLEDVTISDNFARRGGGGAYVFTGNISGSSVSILNNTAGGLSNVARGGGIGLFFDGTTALTESTIQGNSSTGTGGGISARNIISLSLTNSTISQNHGVENGGGILVEAGAQYASATTLINVSINANQLTDSITPQGGGIYIKGAVTVANNLTVMGNLAHDGTNGFGGGIHAGDGAEITVNTGTISGNSIDFSSSSIAKGGGAGVSLQSATFIGSNVNIEENSVTGNFPRGGGVLAHASSLSLNQSTVSGNTEAGHTRASGGGIYVGDSAALTDSVLNLIETTVNSNSVSGLVSAVGAGIVQGPRSSGLIDRSTLSNNTVSAPTSQAGGIFVFCSSPLVTSYACSLTLANSTISGNSATTGGGVLIYDIGSLVAKNTTIYSNQATSDGSQIFTQGSPTIDLSNTLVGTGSSDACYGSGISFSLTGNTNNWFVDASCDGTAVGDPKVGVLADNGGFSVTHLPMLGSGLAKMGAPLVCTSTPIGGLDQRGEPREDPCSIGSVEAPKDEASFFVVPLGNGKVVIFGL